MAWVKVPSENHPVFIAALPKDARVETMKMFGGVAAKVNGNVFAGLFGHSTMIWLPETARAHALALEGASPFDPMGNGVRSDKVMLPESMMKKPAELRRWLTRAFEAAAELPPKAAKPPPKAAKPPPKAAKPPPKAAKPPPKAAKPPPKAAKPALKAARTPAKGATPAPPKAPSRQSGSAQSTTTTKRK